MLLACAGGGEMRPTITPELRAETLELLEARPRPAVSFVWG